MRAGLGQRGRSGRIGIGLEYPAGQRRGQGVVLGMDPQIGRCDTEDWRYIHSRGAAEAVAAARKAVVMPMLMKLCLSVMAGMFPGTGLVVSVVQMKRGMSVAADESDRQQQDQATQEQGSLHGRGTQLRGFEFFPNPA